MNISSIAIRTAPERVDELVAKLEAGNLCEVRLHDAAGRIIVVIESNGMDEELTKVRELEELELVLSAEMKFRYSDEEGAESVEVAQEDGRLVPEVLKDESVPAQQITYGGNPFRRR